MIGRAAAHSLKVARQQTAQANVIPAPLAGMDASTNLSIDTPEVCRWAINAVPAEYGLKVRSGYREWQIGLGNPVRTIIDFLGRDAVTPTATRIFACTKGGIYDVTDAGDSPVLKLTFSTQNAHSGFGTWIHYVTEADDDLIFYADEQNGLFKYDADTDAWAQATGIQAAAGSSGTLEETDICFVCSHKLRIWFITKNSNKAWYLPIRSIAGDCEEFFFAQKFRHGGDLVGLYNWTVDGGEGRDDNLVAISRGGDVIPWTGEDPSDVNTWTSTGTFFIGKIPIGRKIAAEQGGELFILSSLGIITMSDLLRGGDPRDPLRNQIGYRIAPVRNDLHERNRIDAEL